MIVGFIKTNSPKVEIHQIKRKPLGQVFRWEDNTINTGDWGPIGEGVSVRCVMD